MITYISCYLLDISSVISINILGVIPSILKVANYKTHPTILYLRPLILCQVMGAGALPI